MTERTRGRGHVPEPENYRIDHYYSLEGEGEFEEGHIFCTPTEGEEIERILKAKFGDEVTVIVEPGGDYDYSTEQSSAENVAEDILMSSGFAVGYD